MSSDKTNALKVGSADEWTVGRALSKIEQLKRLSQFTYNTSLVQEDRAGTYAELTECLEEYVLLLEEMRVIRF